MTRNLPTVPLPATITKSLPRINRKHKKGVQSPVVHRREPEPTVSLYLTHLGYTHENAHWHNYTLNSDPHEWSVEGLRKRTFS